MTVSEFIITSKNKTLEWKLRPLLVCKDGFTISLQASNGHYCEPREDNLNEYSKVELGFPSEEVKELLPFMDGEIPTESVYGWVDVEIVDKIIKDHKGIDIIKTFQGVV